MADNGALQEAIQRARQLAAQMSQNASVKRPASELDDHVIGTVKVTLAYEKPANSETNREHRSSSNHRETSFNSRENLNHSTINRDKDTRGIDHHHNQHHRNHHHHHNDDRDSRDSSSGYLGAGNSAIAGNANSNAYSRVPPSSGHSMLSGSANYSNISSGEEKIEIIIPHAVIGLVIGKGGENIKRIQNETGATVRVDPTTVDEKGNKVCTITGTKEAVNLAHDQVSNVIENAATNKRLRTQYEGSDQYRMKIPASRTGAIIGKGGETIKSIKQQSGCDIELDKNAKECGPEESVFIIRGTQDKILKAKAMIEARLNSRGRDGDGDGNSNRTSSASKGVATGANAAPVAQFTDLPNALPVNQQTAEMTAAWAAYVAQYSNVYNLAGNQMGAAATGMPYAGQNVMGTTGTQQVPQLDSQQQSQQSQQQQPQPQQQQPQSQSQVPATQQPQEDYADQWIEFYLMHGRPDYAEHVIKMKKNKYQ